MGAESTNTPSGLGKGSFYSAWLRTLSSRGADLDHCFHRQVQGWLPPWMVKFSTGTELATFPMWAKTSSSRPVEGQDMLLGCPSRVKKPKRTETGWGMPSFGRDTCRADQSNSSAFLETSPQYHMVLGKRKVRDNKA